MPTREEAEEHLRVIRSLMERGTIYRAISASGALVGGMVTLLGCGFLALKSPLPGAPSSAPNELMPTPVYPLFLPTWLVVLAVTVLVNIYLLWRDAERRGDVFLSPGLRAALRALIPSCLVAAVLTFLAADFLLPIAWMIFYGLSLLATQHFAPRSIMLLGWAFLATGLGLLLALYATLTRGT
jgi:hypothetical protein